MPDGESLGVKYTASQFFICLFANFLFLNVALILFIALTAISCINQDKNVIDLAGTWGFKIDEQDIDVG